MLAYIKNAIPGLFMLIVAFSYSIYFLAQQAFGLPTEGRWFQIYSGVLALIVVCLFIRDFTSIQSKATYRIFLICGLSVFLFYITRFFYNEPNYRYNSYFLSMGVRFIPALLAGVIMLKNDFYIESLRLAILPFSLFYTFVLSQVILTAEVGVNVGTTFNIEGGMNYQNMSYYSVFAFGMTLYTFLYGNYGKIVRIAIIGLAFIQIIMALMAGGRGAFLLAIIFGLYFGSKKLSIGHLLLYGIIAIFLVFIFSAIVSNNELLEQGIDRIFNFFESSNAISRDDRWIRWGLAWDAFTDSPIWGNGIGSVFYKVGFYSHNLFTDMLCEGGILLTGLFISILLKFYKRSKYLIQLDNRYEMLVLIFLCTFVNLLFSGYYLSESGIWFALAYILNKNPEDCFYEQEY